MATFTFDDMQREAVYWFVNTFIAPIIRMMPPEWQLKFAQFVCVAGAILHVAMITITIGAIVFCVAIIL